MFEVSEIKELITLVGWRQNPDPTGEQLDELLTSVSGIYFNDVHPMLTMDNLLSIAPDDTLYDYANYDGGKTDYAIGNIVEDNNERFIRLVANGVFPTSNSTYWKTYSPFEAWLKTKTEAGLLQAVNDWYDKKANFGTAKNLLSRSTLFDSKGKLNDIQSKEDKVVGIEIVTMRSDSLRTKCKEVALQFDTDQTVTVRVFESGSSDPKYTETLEYTGSGDVQWFPVNWTFDSFQAYHICYNEDDISGNAINGIRDRYFSSGSYSSGRYITARSFSADNDFLSNPFSDNPSYTTATNYGLNLKLNVSCDYTSFIIDQKNLFKDIYAKRVGMMLLRELIYNPMALVNRNEKNVDPKQLLYEIDGASESTKGNNRSLSTQYEAALNSIQFDRTGIDKVCLPCKKRGVKYTTIR